MSGAGRVAFAAAAVVALVGCATSSTDPASGNVGYPRTEEGMPPPWMSEASLEGDLVIFAASSLRGVFADLADRMELAYPQLEVIVNYASSTTLADQVLDGAPADLLATANDAALTRAATAVLDPAVPFAGNQLVIVTAPENPLAIEELTDFEDPQFTLAVCDPDVPCGGAAVTVFEDANLTPDIDTYGENAAATLALVAGGEVDAALVYRTDARLAGGDVAAAEFPGAEDATVTAWIARTSEATQTAAADIFIELLTSDEGREVLAEAGFLLPGTYQ